jgi:hypothetical protein
MKRLILASILCLAFAGVLRAQETFSIDPQLVFPQKAATPSVWGVVQNLQDSHKHQLANTGVCSVQLAEAHVGVNDPGIAATLGNSAVAIPHANVPAPTCESQPGLLMEARTLEGPFLQLPAPLRPATLDPRAVKLDLTRKALTIMGSPSTGGVCSVPLIEAHADTFDPGIATKPSDLAVPIPQARVPAPPCKK